MRNYFGLALGYTGKARFRFKVLRGQTTILSFVGHPPQKENELSGYEKLLWISFRLHWEGPLCISFMFYYIINCRTSHE